MPKILVDLAEEVGFIKPDDIGFIKPEQICPSPSSDIVVVRLRSKPDGINVFHWRACDLSLKDLVKVRPNSVAGYPGVVCPGDHYVFIGENDESGILVFLFNEKAVKPETCHADHLGVPIGISKDRHPLERMVPETTGFSIYNRQLWMPSSGSLSSNKLPKIQNCETESAL